MPKIDPQKELRSLMGARKVSELVCGAQASASVILRLFSNSSFKGAYRNRNLLFHGQIGHGARCLSEGGELWPMLEAPSTVRRVARSEVRYHPTHSLRHEKATPSTGPRHSDKSARC